MKILTIDVSTIAHEVYAVIETSTPTYEAKVFTTQYFRALYQATLEANADHIIFAMDSPPYWRHEAYRKWYEDKVFFAEKNGFLYCQHDGNTYQISQAAPGAYFKKKLKNADIPQEITWNPYLQEKENALGNEEYLSALRAGFPKYKGDRNKTWDHSTPKDEWHMLRNDLTRRIAKAFGARCIEAKNAEADDIIAWIANNKAPEDALTIVSVDTDLDQLQENQNTVRYDPVKQLFILVEEPTYAVRIKILKGDTSDKIPSLKIPITDAKGITKIRPVGIKKAQELLEEGNIWEKAVEEKWDGQLEFNTQMIRLTASPSYIRERIQDAWNMSKEEKEGRIDQFGVGLEEIQKMKSCAGIKKIKFSGCIPEEGEE